MVVVFSMLINIKSLSFLYEKKRHTFVLIRLLKLTKILPVAIGITSAWVIVLKPRVGIASSTSSFVSLSKVMMNQLLWVVLHWYHQNVRYHVKVKNDVVQQEMNRYDLKKKKEIICEKSNDSLYYLHVLRHQYFLQNYLNPFVLFRLTIVQ